MVRRFASGPRVLRRGILAVEPKRRGRAVHDRGRDGSCLSGPDARGDVGGVCIVRVCVQDCPNGEHVEAESGLVRLRRRDEPRRLPGARRLSSSTDVRPHGKLFRLDLGRGAFSVFSRICSRRGVQVRRRGGPSLRRCGGHALRGFSGLPALRLEDHVGILCRHDAVRFSAVRLLLGSRAEGSARAARCQARQARGAGAARRAVLGDAVAADRAAAAARRRPRLAAAPRGGQARTRAPEPVRAALRGATCKA
mmetsp:Transcript_29375/g.101558  ORF Transcript_29375/g.101558 Transcript_29375/m.101558 type:complete len:252 (-) Transcript_29375:6-761(-)